MKSPFLRGLALVVFLAAVIALAILLSPSGSAPRESGEVATTPQSPQSAERPTPAGAETPKPVGAAAAAPTPLSPSPRALPADPHSSNTPDYRQVSTAAAKAPERAAVIERAKIAPLTALKNGDPVQIPLMDGRVISGKIDVVKTNGPWSRVGGALEGGSGRFAIGSNGATVSALIILPRESLAYEITQQKDGQLWIVEKQQADVVCSPLPRAPEPERARSPGPEQAVPILNSRPGAADVIYLDFDGEVVTDTLWGNITATSFNFSAATISAMFDRVKEDWYPFNINVTTDVANYNKAAVGHRMRVIITPDDDAAPGAGGVAYLTSFRNAGTGNYDADIPCWVFNSGVVGVSEAISHEVGHTMGLHHDGRSTPSEAYYLGHGSGATGWCPIMGAGYYKPVVQWSKGEYTAANQQEDDLAIISASYNHFGYMPDDAGNTRASANALSGNPGTGAINQVGLIERTGDVDYYIFSTNGGNVTINAADPSTSPNLDIVLELQDANGNTIAGPNNPTAALNASITASLAAGQYFVKVSPTGAPTVPDTGYTNYGSLGQYLLTGTVQGLTQNPIVTSAATASGQVGVSFGYRIVATGNPSSYGVTGTLPPGTALDTATGQIIGYPTQPGVFTVTVSATNASGTGTRVVTITIADAALTLGEAVDFPSLTYTTTPGAPWVGQKTVFVQDGDAVQSAVIGDGEESSFTTNVTGPTTLSFQWKVSSEVGGDFLILSVDGNELPLDSNGVAVDPISGVVNWTTVSVPLDANPHTISWIYRKNAAFSDAPDTAWVDAITFNSAAAPTITSSPNAGGVVGTPFTYQITANNVPWSFALNSGSLPPGLSLDPETGLISGVPAIAATSTISVTATNNKGPGTPFQITITIDPSAISIATALDDAGGNYAISSNPVGAAKWFPETPVTHDGVDAMQSGPLGDNETTSITKTVSGFNTVNFWWKAEADPSSKVSFFVDGAEKVVLNGISDWENVSYPFGSPGSHTLEWRFTKGTGSLGADAAWLDEVTLTTDLLPVVSTGNANGTEGAFFTYQISATNSPTSFSASGLPKGLHVNASGLIFGIPTENGIFTVVMGAKNLAGTGTAPLNLKIDPAAINLAQAVETATPPKLLWTTDLSAPWFPQTAFSYDNLHAAQSGTTPNGGKSGIEAHVQGPMTVTFRWTVDSEFNKDFLRFYIDGNFQAQISGPMSPAGGAANWEERTFTVDSSDHTLRWVYSKDTSSTAGRDAAWLDAVTLVPGSSLPVVNSPLTATAYLGRPFRYAMTATNAPTSFSAAPIPGGLLFESTTGVISGTPDTAGQTTVSISGTNGVGPGPASALVLTTVPEPPGADAFANATALSGVAISVEGTNAFATAETGEPTHAGRPAKASLWYSWTAPITGSVSVTTAGSAVNTLLSVYEGTALNDLTVIAENDNAGQLVSSALKFNAVANHTYWFAVDAVNGATGRIVLNINYTSNGLYIGLLKDPNQVAAPGLATLTLTSKFSFTGSICFGAAKTSLKGSFTGEDFKGTAPRGQNQTPLQVALHIDLAPGAEEITGQVVADGVTYLLFAKLTLKEVNPVDFRFPELPKKHLGDPTKYDSALSFTFIIEPDDLVTAGLPRGTGYGQATVDKAGKVKTTVVLGDGTKFTAGATVATDKSWVTYLAYKAGGTWAGELLIDAGGLFPPLSATADWVRSPDSKEKVFKTGFGPTTTTLKGYRYRKPGKDISIFQTAAAQGLQFAFTRGDLAPADFTATLDTKNKLTGAPAGWKFTFVPATGLFSGSLLDAGGESHVLGGAILQDTTTRGEGLFFGTTTTGRLKVTPTP